MNLISKTVFYCDPRDRSLYDVERGCFIPDPIECRVVQTHVMETVIGQHVAPIETVKKSFVILKPKNEEKHIVTDAELVYLTRDYALCRARRRFAV